MKEAARRYLTGVALLGAVLSSSFAFAKQGASEWILKQQQNDLGAFTVYLCHDAAKVVCESGGFVLVTRAPDWNVICYNPKEKLIWSGPLGTFEARMLVNPFADGLIRTKKRASNDTFWSKGKVEKVGSGTSDGMRYIEYIADMNTRKYIYWGAVDVPVDPHCAEFMCKISAVPHIDQVPWYIRKTTLKLAHTYADVHLSHKDLPFYTDDASGDLRLGPQVRVVTKSWKKLALNSKDFDLPEGYKKVTDLMDVTYSHDMKDELTNAITTAGFSAQTGAKKTTDRSSAKDGKSCLPRGQ